MRDRLNQVYDILDSYCPKEISFLDKREPFQFLICVVLSAQTTDKKVNEVAKVLFARYPEARDLAAADYDDVLQIIRYLGLSRTKARNIIAIAEILRDRAFPSSMEELLTLPGVGRKTANCVLGEVYGKGVVIVDTHVLRVSNRLDFVDTDKPEVVEKTISSGMDEDKLYRMSMILNWFGRNICLARKPKCDVCPLSGICSDASHVEQTR